MSSTRPNIRFIGYQTNLPHSYDDCDDSHHGVATAECFCCEKVRPVDELKSDPAHGWATCPACLDAIAAELGAA